MKRLITLAAIAVLAVAAALFGMTASSRPAQAAATHTVCASGCDFTTIQAAINSAGTLAGDTISVKAGTYVENVVVTKSVTIAGAGQAFTKIVPAVSNPNPCEGSSLCGSGSAASNVILVQADNVTITGLTVDGNNPALTSGIAAGGVDLDARNGIITNHLIGTYTNLTVHHVTVKNVYLRGIYASSGGSFNFHDNTVTNVQASYYSIGIFAWYGPGTIANNRVSWAGDAISANHSKGIQFVNNVVTHSGSGVHTDNSNDSGGVPDLIQGNKVSDCQGYSWSPQGYGIWVFLPYAAPKVKNNTVEDCDVGLATFGQGAAVTPVFSGNRVNGNGKPGSMGAWLTTDQLGFCVANVSVQMTGNVIKGFETGILLEAPSVTAFPIGEPCSAATPSATATFDKGQLSKNGTGLKVTGGTATITNSCVAKNSVGLLQSGGSAAAHGNVISGNSAFGAKNASGPSPFDATGNYWGSASGPNPPGSGDKVFGSITVSPWLTAVPTGVKCSD